jgi:glycosyltransferase involved in cell wall biosynthesis
MLAIIETHPIQYHAPVYRELQTQFDVPVMAIYGSDFSIAGYSDREFGESFAWDTDLLSGYRPVFLSQVSRGGARSFEEVSAEGLGRVLREVAPKVVLITGYSQHFNQEAFYEAWKAKYPILFRGEATDHARNRNRLKSLVRDTILRWYYQHSTRLLYIGRSAYQHYKRLDCPDEKLIFSPYCVDISPFHTDESAREDMRVMMRRALNIDEEQKALLFSGKLSHRKGPDLILKAVKLLSQEIGEKVVVIFLGNGQLIDGLKRLAYESPQVKVVFPGFKNQTQLSPYYHAADLLILPSRENETWGLVVNEALHHGLPCIVSDAVGCSPDLIEQGVTGMVFETGSSQSLASVLQQAFELIGRDDVRQNCRQKVSRYSVKNAARGIAEAYWQVVGKAAARRAGMTW